MSEEVKAHEQSSKSVLAAEKETNGSERSPWVCLDGHKKPPSGLDSPQLTVSHSLRRGKTRTEPAAVP